ncbi:hypothetical protein AB4Z46_04725 [Variovorax sp. M-6]|uniref:hypothetical protein n=1 Tax=Variovorax sp. M-6 TaxID=3233041 RepID=UPI003F98A01F
MPPITEREVLCRRYRIDDPSSAGAEEACERVERLEGFCSTRFIERLNVERRGALDFSLNEERWFAEETRTWAMQNDLERVEALARQAIDRLDAIELLASRIAQKAIVEVDETEGPRLSFEEQLAQGDYNVDAVMKAINARGGEVEFESFGRSLYSFVIELLSTARSRHDGNVGAALADRFQFDHGLAWGHYRAVTYQLSIREETEPDSAALQLLEVIDAPPELADLPHGELFPSADEARSRLRAAVDRQCPDDPGVAFRGTR